MDFVWKYFKVQLPGYLKSLPLPKTIGGFSELSRGEWLELVPFFLFLLILVYLILSPFLSAIGQSKKPRPQINKRVKKDESKVVNSFDIEDLAKKDENSVFCRCWKSKKFPYCDGSHNTHNQETGDNVGPLIMCVKKKESKKKN